MEILQNHFLFDFLFIYRLKINIMKGKTQKTCNFIAAQISSQLTETAIPLFLYFRGIMTKHIEKCIKTLYIHMFNRKIAIN